MSGDQDIAYTSAVSLLELYRKRALSPVEVTRLLLDRLDALQPKINAFCIIDHEGALAAARASEQRWVSGGRIGKPAAFESSLEKRGQSISRRWSRASTRYSPMGAVMRRGLATGASRSGRGIRRAAVGSADRWWEP